MTARERHRRARQIAVLGMDLVMLARAGIATFAALRLRQGKAAARVPAMAAVPAG